MSYKAPQKPRKSAKMFYPNTTPAGKMIHPISKKETIVSIKTGPYKKVLCGTDYNGVHNYLTHLVEEYNKQRESNNKKAVE